MKSPVLRLMVFGSFLSVLVFSAASTPARGESTLPILIEQKIISVDLKPEFRDGIRWNLLKLYLNNRKSTTGAFPLSERARHRLDFRPMKKNVSPGQEQNIDFEYVEQTRKNEFKFGTIWEDVRNPAEVTEDTHFGALRIFNFNKVMDFIREQADARVLFSRKWITESGEQSMISTQPEVTQTTGGRRGGGVGEIKSWEGARSTIKPEVLENNQIAFHLDSEIATYFYGNPLAYPDFPVVERGDEKMARIWRLFRLNTRAIVESGQTAVFEDVREGKGIFIFLTPYILESHRKIFQP